MTKRLLERDVVDEERDRARRGGTTVRSSRKRQDLYTDLIDVRRIGGVPRRRPGGQIDDDLVEHAVRQRGCGGEVRGCVASVAIEAGIGGRIARLHESLHSVDEPRKASAVLGAHQLDPEVQLRLAAPIESASAWGVAVVVLNRDCRLPKGGKGYGQRERSGRGLSFSR